MVDLKVFPAFLRFVPFQSPTLQRHIICMIVNRLYTAPDAVLNKEALEGARVCAHAQRRYDVRARLTSKRSGGVPGGVTTTVIGGIEFINTLYAQTNSREASDNLFAVIFDYAVSEVGDKKKTGQNGTKL